MRARLTVLIAVAALSAAQSAHSVLARANSMESFPVECNTFTDDPIVTAMLVKRDHIVQLRDCVAALRAE